MSTLTLTFNEFMALTPAAHQAAVKLFTAEINHLRRVLKLDAPGSRDYVANSEQLDLLVSLVKVHQGRLDELQAESQETDGSTVAIAA